MEREKLPWLVPGVEVLVYSRGRDDKILGARRTSVARVNKATFSVADSTTQRFSVDYGEDCSGSAWDPIRRVVPWRSDEAEGVFMALAVQRIAHAAEAAADAWMKNPTRTNRLGAIAALEAIRGDKD